MNARIEADDSDQAFPRPVRIAFCITDLDAGGAERALVQIVTRLNRRRWEPFVFCLSGEGVLAAELRAAGVPVTCLGVRGAHDVAVVWRLSRRLAKLRPAILQTFLYHANIVGRLAGKLAGVPKIISGIRVAERRSRLRLWVDRMTDVMVAAHVCVSQDVAAFSAGRGGLPAQKIRVITNGVDASKFSGAAAADLAQFGIPAGSRTILFVGRLDPQKGPLILLAAVRNLLPAHPELHLLMVGDGPLGEKIQACVRQEDLTSQVHLIGRRDDVPSLMRAAELFVLPSLWEGLPNVVLEAMAAGTPVISSRVEGIHELLRENETGVVVDPGSPGELERAIASALADPATLRAMAAMAQMFVAKEFTWERIAREYDHLYAGNLSPELHF